MPDDEFRRLSWACRRGMLELDVLLQHFLKTEYAGLPEMDKEQFSSLLQLPDPVLQHYFNGDKRADDPEQQKLIDRIRYCLCQSGA